MRVRCRLRELRARRPITEIAELAGVNKGELSKYERGIAFPRDHQLPGMERAYGAPAETWYEPAVLRGLEADPPETD